MALDKETLKEFEVKFNEKWGAWRRFGAMNPNSNTFISIGVGLVLGLLIAWVF